MKELWSCSSCLGFFVLAVLAPTTIAAHDGIYKVHQLEKNDDYLRHPKREASCQQPGYSLCPASLEGGCCPGGYACAASSCYATTAGPTSACGTAGYYNCPITAGGCCPVGLICQRNDCSMPVGASYSYTCPASYNACPSSLGYGCCPNGMQCGSKSCFGTTPETFPVSGTVTTTNAKGDTITTVVTSTEVITPGVNPSATSSANTVAGVPKLIPSTVSKLPAVETDTSNDSGGDSSSSGGGGLSGGQLGGIVGGAVALLIIIVTIAGIVLWRLKRTEKAAQAAAESQRESSSGNQKSSQKSGFGRPSISEVDGTDVDSVALRARRAAYYRARSPSSTAGGPSRSETPEFYGSNASTTPPTWPGYFAQQLPASESSDGRQSSLDHANAQYQPRPSDDSQGPRPPGHARHWSSSDASELDGSGVTPELESPDAIEAAGRRSSSVTRRGGRSESAPAAAPLGTLSEVNELHGYYGAPDLAVGQTAAKLRAKNSSINSLPEKDM